MADREDGDRPPMICLILFGIFFCMIFWMGVWKFAELLGALV